MKILFTNKLISELILDLTTVKNSKNLLERKIGKNLTRDVKNRINELEAMPTFYEYQQNGLGHIKSLSGNLKFNYSLRLNKNYRLIIKPKSNDLSPGNLKNCDSVYIIGVIDYHGKNKKNDWLIP